MGKEKETKSIPEYKPLTLVLGDLCLNRLDMIS